MTKKPRSELYYQVKRGCGLEELTHEQIGQIFLSLETYDGTRQHFEDAAMRLVYKQLCDHIDQENESYEVIREKRRQASHARQVVKDKQSQMTSNDIISNQMTSNDNIRHQTTSNNHNQNHNQNHNHNQTERKTKESSQPAASLDEGWRYKMIETWAADQSWIVNLSQELLIPTQQIETGLRRFQIQITNEQDESDETERDLLKHFKNWMRIDKRELTKNKSYGDKQASSADKRRRIDISANRPEEYTTTF